MPKFSSYPVVTTLDVADKFMLHQDSSNSEKLITTSSLRNAIAAKVNSIADLKNLAVATFVTNQQVQVLGYYEPGDGGGGVFFYDSTSGDADNGGTIIAPNSGSGRWIRAVTGGSLFARWFGAKGDNTNLDHGPIQAAINALPAEGGAVYVNNGTYKCTQQLLLEDNKALIGESRDSTILSFPSAAIDGINPRSGACIRDITIRGPNVEGVGVGGIDSGSADGVVIENAVIEKWGGHGINTGGLSTNWVIRNCHVRENFYDGIFIAGASSKCLVEGNFVYDNGSNGIDVNGDWNIIKSNELTNNGAGIGTGFDSWGILISAIPGVNSNNNIVEGNIVRTSFAQGIIIRGDTGQSANYTQVIGNKVSGGTSATADGILVDGSAVGTITGTIIIGNTVVSNARDGIAVGGGAGLATISNTQISLNTVVSNAGTGINCQGANITNTVIGMNVVLSNAIAQINTTGSVRTRLVSNINNTSSYNEMVLASGTLNASNNFLGVGGDGNTEIRLTSTGAGRRPFSSYIDQFGNFNIYDVTSGDVMFTIEANTYAKFVGNAAGVKGTANVQFDLDSSGSGRHKYSWYINQFGKSFLRDSTAAVDLLELDPSSGVNALTGFTVGSGDYITKLLTGAATLNFGSTAAQTSSDLTINVPGAALNNPVMLGVNAGAYSSNTCYTAFVSAADTVTVRFNNYSSGAVDPGAQEFWVIVAKF